MAAALNGSNDGPGTRCVYATWWRLHYATHIIIANVKF